MLDANHEFYGRIHYPSEGRYDNRGTGCAVLAFWRLYGMTGEDRFADQARLARDTVLNIQEDDGGYAELGRNQVRMDEGSIVNTGLISDSLVLAYRAGLDYDRRDIESLCRMADYMLTLEWLPGAFYHDEGHAYRNSKMDCQNTTALAGMSLLHIYDFVKENGGPADPRWLEAAQRTIPRIIAGQEDTGQWPYRLGEIEKYPCDMNHHGMLAMTACEIYSRLPDPDLLDRLIRGAYFLTEDTFLHTERGTKHNWAYQRSACLYFTQGYFLTSSYLALLSQLDKDHGDTWAHEAREIMRYVRTDLWHCPAPGYEHLEEGPYRMTEQGLAPGYAFHGQALAWCSYQMDYFMRALNVGFPKI